MSYLHIRRYRPEDAAELHDLYYTSIHQACQNDYTASQLDGWAPQRFDRGRWLKLLELLNPRIVECKGQLVAYADLQQSGLMNHFFVHGEWQGKGVGKVLLRHLEDLAFELKLPEISCFISISGQPFFKSHGFKVDYSLSSEVHGQWIENARMYKQIALS
ncbi:GNAT family N-acetyltransferase [Iodobacter sp.]|uniref:GNAT family N-acetyltransferase n=1 Tax=Iodobacter sp. TaxID=1915058 RepID=UPI0025D4C1E7|nr:GNAT family N-acetyltransferase [Iodobacter sp.]